MATAAAKLMTRMVTSHVKYVGRRCRGYQQPTDRWQGPTGNTRNRESVTSTYNEDDWEEEGEFDDLLGVLAWHGNISIYKGMLKGPYRETKTYQDTQIKHWVDGFL